MELNTIMAKLIYTFDFELIDQDLDWHRDSTMDTQVRRLNPWHCGPTHSNSEQWKKPALMVRATQWEGANLDM
jgi:hypothetical protein